MAGQQGEEFGLGHNPGERKGGTVTSGRMYTTTKALAGSSRNVQVTQPSMRLNHVIPSSSTTGGTARGTVRGHWKPPARPPETTTQSVEALQASSATRTSRGTTREEGPSRASQAQAQAMTEAPSLIVPALGATPYLSLPSDIIVRDFAR